jgi:hypothetical protein
VTNTVRPEVGAGHATAVTRPPPSPGLSGHLQTGPGGGSAPPGRRRLQPCRREFGVVPGGEGAPVSTPVLHPVLGSLSAGNGVVAERQFVRQGRAFPPGPAEVGVEAA